MGMKKRSKINPLASTSKNSDLKDVDYDLCVIGGGINGAGIARDAAGRGLSVLLLEAQDLASGTSSSSTKLIHGGLRYLEYFEFRLVRESLHEREVLLRLAPHIIWPMTFVLPHTPSQRPGWMIRLGLFLYDHLAKRRVLNGSGGINFRQDAAGDPLKDSYRRGFHYSDCWADDSRLVALNAQDAAARGAQVMTRTQCTKIKPDGDVWDISMRKTGQKKDRHVRASMVINAAGPWVQNVIDDAALEAAQKSAPRIRLVKGSHIITKRLYEGEQSYILQQPDNRIVFAIPYEENYTLIGTTEEDHRGDPMEARLSDDELAYLVEAYNRFFEGEISKDDVLWSYSGVRPLFDEGAEEGENATSVSRDYKLHMHEGCSAPMISVFGGKLTTYRVLAEEAVNKIMHLGGVHGAPWSEHEALPGGDIPDLDFEAFVEAQSEVYPWLAPEVLYRYARSYGTQMDVILDDASGVRGLGKHFGDGVYEAEIVYLMTYEFAQEAEDIFWRRSKLGLHVGDKTLKNVAAFMKTYIKRVKA